MTPTHPIEQASMNQPKSGQISAPTAVEILGVRINAVDFAQLLTRLEDWIEDKPQPTTPAARPYCRQVCTVNPEFIMEARRNAAFAALLQRADLCVPDGVGVLWAARMLGVRLAERVTGSDGIYRLCERAAQRGWRVFFLGAGPGVAAQTAARLTDLYPGLHVAGVDSGSPNEADWPAIRQLLHEAQPDLLFVAYGHPRQDFWIDRHRHELPVRVALGVGGAFDFVAGVRLRAPRWVQRLGLEWLHRLLHEPWRWRRMRKLPHFAALVILQAIARARQP
jgi:N-acetylglucosaminyldiphosphoundecaprenol N-acetyl-beta-D-mannosaminyltransferase